MMSGLSKPINAEYSRRINRAMQYIVDHLDNPPSLDDVARFSYFSPFHFHRIFHAIVGETVNDFMMRKRMELAVCRLLSQREKSITEVANIGGFSSSANFSKAFKLYFGITPSQLRSPSSSKSSKIGKLYSKYGKAFNPQDLYSQFVTNEQIFDSEKLEELLMNVRIEKLEAKSIALLTAPNGYELEGIFSTWDKLIAWGQSIGIEESEQEWFAICHDNPMVTPTEQCRYDAAIMVDEAMKVAAPYTKQVIPEGQYAVAYYKGDGDKVSNFYMELYSAWLPTSGFEPDDYPPIAHYLNDVRADGHVEMELNIKLKAL
tara:strand:- start:48109 stop:49059 length:951 start_codon:yes stop_codon:yes gene_type:complete